MRVENAPKNNSGQLKENRFNDIFQELKSSEQQQKIKIDWLDAILSLSQ